MTSPRNPSKPVVPPSRTDKVFSTRKSNDRGSSVTSERIAQDIAAFNESGGRIEVLGNTRALKKIGVDADAAADAQDADAKAPAVEAKPQK